MSSCLIQKLQERGHRITPQRAAILRILEQSDAHLTPGEVYKRVKEILPEITEPTIYRTLAFLSDQGLLMVAHIGCGQLVYEPAGHPHHHLICKACNHSIKIDHAVLEPIYQQLQASTGFYVDSLHVTFFGLCPHCQKMETDVED